MFLLTPLACRSTAPASGWRMIGDSERLPHQLQHRFQQALCLAQPQAKHKAQRQGGLDRQIRIAGLAATRLGACHLNRASGVTHSQTATMTKSCLIFWSVRHPELHLLDTMAAGAIVFERHD